MNKTSRSPGRADQREALERSEKKAAKDRPQNYKDEANDDKVVEVGPDLRNAPIEGIDPDPTKPRKR
jgi:hypothetical protein